MGSHLEAYPILFFVCFLELQPIGELLASIEGNAGKQNKLTNSKPAQVRKKKGLQTVKGSSSNSQHTAKATSILTEKPKGDHLRPDLLPVNRHAGHQTPDEPCVAISTEAPTTPTVTSTSRSSADEQPTGQAKSTLPQMHSKHEVLMKEKHNPISRKRPKQNHKKPATKQSQREGQPPATTQPNNCGHLCKGGNPAAIIESCPDLSVCENDDDREVEMFKHFCNFCSPVERVRVYVKFCMTM